MEMRLQWVWGGWGIRFQPLPGDVNPTGYGDSRGMFHSNKLDSGIENTTSTSVQHILSYLDTKLRPLSPIQECSYAAIS